MVDEAHRCGVKTNLASACQIINVEFAHLLTGTLIRNTILEVRIALSILGAKDLAEPGFFREVNNTSYTACRTWQNVFTLQSLSFSLSRWKLTSILLTFLYLVSHWFIWTSNLYKLWFSYISWCWQSKKESILMLSSNSSIGIWFLSNQHKSQ